MGQRHQIFLAVPEVKYPTLEDGTENQNNKPAKVFGFHHQWLYGWRAITSLYNLCKFVTSLTENKNKEVFSYLATRIQDPCNLLEKVYTLDVEDTYMSNISKLHDGAELNPLESCDNNNGFTLIQITGNPEQPIKYCFFALERMECKFNHKIGEPMNVTEWLQTDYTLAEVQDDPGVIKVMNLFNNSKIAVLTKLEVSKLFPGFIKPNAVAYAESIIEDKGEEIES